MSKKKLYYILIVLSIVLFTISMTVLNETTYIGPIVIVISIYLLLGSIVKLCKTNNKLKNTVICAVDLLFWLP